MSQESVDSGLDEMIKQGNKRIKKMIKIGKTFDRNSKVVDVYECEKCKARTFYPKEHKCRRKK